MTNKHDFSAVSQYAALGQEMRRHSLQVRPNKAPHTPSSGLEALGRRTGLSDISAPAKPTSDHGLKMPSVDYCHPADTRASCDA